MLVQKNNKMLGLTENPEVWLEAIQISSGDYLESEEDCLKALLETNFPSFTEANYSQEQHLVRRPKKTIWDYKIVSPEKVSWSVHSFLLYKTFDPDGVYPVLL